MSANPFSEPAQVDQTRVEVQLHIQVDKHVQLKIDRS
jgi:hypothetical protein